MFMQSTKKFLVLAVALSLYACHATYPQCDADEDCHGHGEVCLNGQCQECREDAQCDLKYPGTKHSCVAGRCEASAECHLDVDCHTHGDAFICHDGKCIPECGGDADCGAGHRCVAQKCVAACAEDQDCASGEACLNGQCQSAENAAGHVSSECRPKSTLGGDVVLLEMVNFEFNQYDLTTDSQDKLGHAVMCLKQAPPSLQVVVEGHCDDRGTQEYNLALGERRAQSVLKFFRSQGIADDRLILRSKGENEPLCNDATEACYAENRRVQFIQQLGSSATAP